jgi:thymidylate kinase
MTELIAASGQRAAAAAMAARLLRVLEREGIPYCVLGDTRSSARNGSGDLDLMIAPEVLQQLSLTIRRFCRETGLELVQCWQHEVTCFFYVLAWRGDSGRHSFLMPDVCGDFLRNGRLYLTAAELLPERRRAYSDAGEGRGFVVPAPRHGFIYYLLKKVDKLSLAEGQAKFLNGLWSEDPAGASAQIDRFWHRADAAVLAEAARTGQWRQVRAQLPELRAALHRRLPRSPYLAWAEARRRVRQALYPAGLQVVLLGSDGSGKSSVIEALLRTGVPGFRRLHYTHFRPEWGNPQNTRLNPLPNPRPHGERPRSVLASTAKLLYYASDFLTGYLVDTRPRMVRSTLILFDRYYNDLLVDPRRYRYGGALSVARWIGKLVPRPGLIILLDAPAAILRARKQELPVQEIERQREAYLTLTRSLSYGRVVDAAKPLDRVVADVEQVIVQRAAQLTRARLGL